MRTAWVFGPGRNFVATILEAAARAVSGHGPALRVVDDQRGSPTYAGHLADALVALVEAGAPGIYHVAGSGTATWWDLARAAVDASGHPELPIAKITTQEFPRPAPRPAWSVLDLGKAERAGVRMPSWQEGLHAYLESAASPLAGARPVLPTGDPA
jgi:dTDP-4-dehydrorhamnose reductase